MEDDEIKRKPARITNECFKMLDEAVAYIANNSERQAEIMNEKFRKIAKILEILPGIGTACGDGLRNYREQADCIKLVGIWQNHNALSTGTAAC